MKTKNIKKIIQNINKYYINNSKIKLITYIADESSNTLMAQLLICKIIRHLTLIVMGGTYPGSSMCEPVSTCQHKAK